LAVLPKAFTLAKFDAEPVEDLFEKTLSNLELAQGWLWVMETEMSRKKGLRLLTGLKDDRERGVVRAGLEVAKSIAGKAI
jgi:hypothetical protein